MQKILIIQADFYQHITEMLYQGASKKLTTLGYQHQVITVRGALEIASVINHIHHTNHSKDFNGYIALGCVIRGETSHYDIVCNESASSLNHLILNYNLSIVNGIITVENEQQAIKRADPNQKNKGGYCAEAIDQLIKIKQNYL
jgi:6,7-dimethyl-8-ribityllumazine synthase